jgi:hypothetical protein
MMVQKMVILFFMSSILNNFLSPQIHYGLLVDIARKNNFMQTQKTFYSKNEFWIKTLFVISGFVLAAMMGG